MTHVAHVTSSVLFVADLERSISFYSEVFRCEIALHQGGGALLLTPEGFQLYIIAKGSSAPHFTGNIGEQYLMWATDSREGFEEFKHALEVRDCYTDTHSSGDATFVEGRDPDGIRIVVAHPSPQQHPRSVLNNRFFS